MVGGEGERWDERGGRSQVRQGWQGRASCIKETVGRKAWRDAGGSSGARELPTLSTHKGVSSDNMIDHVDFPDLTRKTWTNTWEG